MNGMYIHIFIYYVYSFVGTYTVYWYVYRIWNYSIEKRLRISTSHEEEFLARARRAWDSLDKLAHGPTRRVIQWFSYPLRRLLCVVHANLFFGLQGGSRSNPQLCHFRCTGSLFRSFSSPFASASEAFSGASPVTLDQPACCSGFLK